MVPRPAAAVLLAIVILGACADGLEQPRTLPADKATMRQALLTPGDDLPGYEVNERVTVHEVPEGAACDQADDGEGVTVRRAFSPADDMGGATLVEAIEVSDPAAARAAIAEVADVVTCSEAGAPEVDVPSLTYEAHDAPPLGDEAAAFSVDMRGGLIEVDSEVVLVRIGDTVVSVATLALNGVDPAFPPGVVERAVAKVGAAAH